MLKPVFLDMVSSPIDELASYVGEHKTVVAIVSCAVIAAIVLLVVLIKLRKKGA